MLEKEAVKKICHASMPRDNPCVCVGSKCIAWCIWADPKKDKNGDWIVGDDGKAQSIPKKPAQGHCEMIPPELNCGN